jgi:hypothetical protein
MASASPSVADLLEATSRELAGTDARVYRRVGTHLQRTAQAIEELNKPATAPSGPALALLGRCTFQQQSVATLKGLCKQHGIKGFSKYKKADLVRVLEQHGVEPPPRPLESFSKAELIGLVRQLLAATHGG